MNMELDAKVRWKNLRAEQYDRIVHCSGSQNSIRDRVKQYKEGLYESPKVFVDGYARNDGSWVKYYRVGKIKCCSKEEIGRYIYGYTCFLLKVGIEDWDEMLYYCLCYLIDVLDYKKGVFGCSTEKIHRLESAISSVCMDRPKKVLTAKIDDREFCLDPQIIKDMSVKEERRLQKRVQKQITDDKIAGLYNGQLSVRKNIEEFRNHFLDISVGRLEQWIQENIKD